MVCVDLAWEPEISDLSDAEDDNSSNKLKSKNGWKYLTIRKLEKDQMVKKLYRKTWRCHWYFGYEEVEIRRRNKDVCRNKDVSIIRKNRRCPELYPFLNLSAFTILPIQGCPYCLICFILGNTIQNTPIPNKWLTKNNFINIF